MVIAVGINSCEGRVISTEHVKKSITVSSVKVAWVDGDFTWMKL